MTYRAPGVHAAPIAVASGSIAPRQGALRARKRPGEGNVIATNVTTGTAKLRYRTSMPYATDRGNVTELALYAGLGVDDVRDIPSAAELVARLWKECLDAT